MSTASDINGAGTGQPGTLTLPLFVLTIFVSAALLFSVQPMFAKMVLPQLGGSPGVWSVAMVVFQSLLLAGYAYAHALNRWLPGIPGIVLHIFVTLAAAATLPFSISSTGAPPSDGEMLFTIMIFLTAIGPSFFALSANGPLLQAWFIHSRHASAHDPYFLYAASNIGSFLALFAYPFMLEPMLTLGQQREYWTIGYFLLASLLTLCGFRIAKNWKHTDLPRDNANEPALPVTLPRALGWIGLSAVPSGLLVAVSQQISTDVASAPMLWVIPLALYLATFIIVFQKRPVLPHGWMKAVQPVLVALVVVTTLLDPAKQLAIVLGIHLAAFFVTAMVCHGELVQRRPAAQQLTAFYLAMSFGGMLGGMFCGLIAPKIFNWVAEYPMLIVLALLCRPGGTLNASLRNPVTWVAIAIGAAALLIAALGFGKLAEGWSTLQMMLLLVLIAASLIMSGDRLRLALPLAAAFVLAQYFPADGRSRVTIRSFFGVHKISSTPDGRYRLLAHGTTIHGAQELKDDAGKTLTGRPVPISYYLPQGTIAQAIEAARQSAGGVLLQAGIVGLGTGSLACLEQPGEHFRFYEIDADVVRIARNPDWFTFISSCKPDIPIVMGDARLTLEREPDGAFDTLVIDAFSSDAIPVHLMTKEAVALYKRKLKPHGVLILHISNWHMELATEAASVAHANNMVIAVNDEDTANPIFDPARFRFDATVAVMANEQLQLEPLLKQKGWELRSPEAGHRIWTDDYSNILGAILRKLREDDDEDD